MIISDDSARVQYLLQRNLKLVTEICRLRVVNANLQRKNSALSRELLVRSVNLKKSKSTQTVGLENSPCLDRTQEINDRYFLDAENLSPNITKSWQRLSIFKNVSSFDSRVSMHTNAIEGDTSPEPAKPVWSSPAINRVANRLSKRITNKRYTAQPETDVEMVATGSGTPENRTISSRSSNLAFKKPVCSDDIEEERDDIKENIDKQTSVAGYSESHRITSDTDKDINSIASPCHSHTTTAATTVTPVEEVKRAQRGIAKPLSYKEPALNTKIRKGIKFFTKV